MKIYFEEYFCRKKFCKFMKILLMALLKVFVSSTCYDLGMVRAELRNFILNLGHEPVMSDYNDILFDPKDHTHESCIKEIPNSDAVVLIIGSRFGGKAIPKAISGVEIQKFKSTSKNSKLLESPDSISITQLEILKAIDANIPVFTFVDSRVMHDHLFYEKNKDKGIIDSIDFPSIDRKETAVYIFEFINFLRFRSKNNSIVEFSKISDIEDFLKKQWSALLQRLLFEQRGHKNELKRIQNFSEELKDIKSLIISSISSTQAKEIARGVLKYRRLVDFLLAFQHTDIKGILVKNITWEELLSELQIEEVKLVTIGSRYRPYLYLIRNDNTFYEYRLPVTNLTHMANEWNSFRILGEDVKTEIIMAISENDRHLPSLKYHNEQFEYFLSSFEERRLIEDKSSTSTISRTTLSEQTDPDSGDL